ncbi:MAG: hypothetical protein ACFB9M_18955 [Myxococcota bacterium]
MSRCLEPETLAAIAWGHRVSTADERHLESCARCQVEYRQLQRLSSLLPARHVEPSPAFDAALRARLEEEDERRARRWPRHPMFILAPALAAAGIIVAVGLPPGPAGPHEPLPDPRLLADLELFEAMEASELVDVLQDLDVIRKLPSDEG